MPAGPQMLMTLALCTHNHRDRLERTLHDLGQLREPASPWELLIVDNASSDGTAELLASASWRRPACSVRVVRENRLGISNARNRAINEAAADYIIFIDDDETPEPDWLVTYEKAIRTEQPDAMGGRINVIFEDGPRPRWLQDDLLGFLGRLDYGESARRLEDRSTPVFTGNSGFRKQVFSRIGMFDVDLGRKGAANTGGEDTDLYRRLIDAGCHVWWVPQAVIHHRIQAAKLRRRYFLDLHYRQGRIEGVRKRGSASRVPPAYLIPQLWRACKATIMARIETGSRGSLRKEMNVAYFLGYLGGWMSRKLDIH